MARKVVNRKALREEVEAAEKAEKKAPKTKAAKKKATKRKKARSKEPAEVRMKLFWGVFNQSLKRIALYEFSQKKQADEKAAALSKDGKTPHFVQKVKEVIEE